MKWGLGLTPEGFDRRLRVVEPSLPHWVNRVEVSGIAFAGANVDLTFERGEEQVSLADARIDGDVEAGT